MLGVGVEDPFEMSPAAYKDPVEASPLSHKNATKRGGSRIPGAAFGPSTWVSLVARAGRAQNPHTRP